LGGVSSGKEKSIIFWWGDVGTKGLADSTDRRRRGGEKKCSLAWESGLTTKKKHRSPGINGSWGSHPPGTKKTYVSRKDKTVIEEEPKEKIRLEYQLAKAGTGCGKKRFPFQSHGARLKKKELGEKEERQKADGKIEERRPFCKGGGPGE